MLRAARHAVILSVCLSAAAALAQGEPVAAPEGATGDGDAIQVPGAIIGRMGDPAVVDPSEYEFSDAETRLWLADHLKNIERPARLHYEFQKTGSFEEGFVDSVYLDIVEINADGTKNAEMQFFTGPRAQGFGSENVTEITGNPVLGTYLGGDIDELNRLTGAAADARGRWRYFQRRIKLALAESATIEDITVNFQGRQVQAQRITITPFTKDPHRSEFEQFAEKRYEFVLSDEIPGTIYQIRTLVPGANGATAPLIEETLTLSQVEVRG
jgi:hypothetical protein